jgi:hypothetical protein
MNVEISLNLARRLWDHLVRGTPQAEEDLRELDQLIVQANGALIPGPWRRVSVDRMTTWVRDWPTGIPAAVVRDAGWFVRQPSRPNEMVIVIGSGPEAGDAGCLRADTALSQWAIQQGWRP